MKFEITDKSLDFLGYRALRDLLEFHRLDYGRGVLGEGMVFGLAGGLGFLYLELQGAVVARLVDEDRRRVIRPRVTLPRPRGVEQVIVLFRDPRLPLEQRGLAVLPASGVEGEALCGGADAGGEQLRQVERQPAVEGGGEPAHQVLDEERQPFLQRLVVGELVALPLARDRHHDRSQKRLHELNIQNHQVRILLLFQ